AVAASCYSATRTGASLMPAAWCWKRGFRGRPPEAARARKRISPPGSASAPAPAASPPTASRPTIASRGDSPATWDKVTPVHGRGLSRRKVGKAQFQLGDIAVYLHSAPFLARVSDDAA